MIIPAVTLTQPWATMMAIEMKRFETRKWKIAHRGPLAIHAGKSLTPVGGIQGLRRICAQEPFRGLLRASGYTADTLPLGQILAVARVVDVWRFEEDAMRSEDTGVRARLPGRPELAMGDYTPGRYGWQTSGLWRLPTPVSISGAQGLWRWEIPENLYEIFTKEVLDK